MRGNVMVFGILLLVGGLLLIVWGADWFTDGAIRTAAVTAISPFYVGIIVSGLEPENLVTGLTAAIQGYPQIALGTVIGSAIFLLTGALGIALLLVPMEIRIPRAGGGAILLSAGTFALTIWDADVTRFEGAVLLVVAIGLLVWLHRSSPVFLKAEAENDDDGEAADTSRVRAFGLLLAGLGVLVVGAECVVRGVGTLISSFRVSETFLGMAVVGMGESLEETARMVPAARRGHADLAWGNVVGTVVILLGVNLGIVSLVQPLVADALVIRLHVPYLVACVVLVAGALLVARRLGRRMGLVLVGLYLLYLVFNLKYIWA
jgi:cation:H+ antiporter